MEKIVNGHKYELKEFAYLEQTIIDNESSEVTPDGQTKENRGTLMGLTIFFAIESWDLTREKKSVPLPSERVLLDGIPRLNTESYRAFLQIFPKRDKLEVFLAASKLNRLGEAEKNSSSGPSAETSTTAK